MKRGDILLNRKNNKMSICYSVNPFVVVRYSNGFYRHMMGGKDYFVLDTPPINPIEQVEYFTLLGIKTKLL